MRKKVSVFVLLILCVICSGSCLAFSDIEDPQLAKQIEELSAFNIINGYEDGTFKPDNKLTRGQASIIACNMLLYCGLTMNNGKGYPDTNGHYAEKHINYLAALGVVNGFDDGTFRPDLEITRGQAAIIIANCLTVLGK